MAMVVYAFKRVTRSWKLFIALLLGVILASSFFAGINISVDSVGIKSLNQQLEQIYADAVVSSSVTSAVSSQNVTFLKSLVSGVEGVTDISVISRTVSTQALPVKVGLPDGSKISFRPSVDIVIGISNNSYIHKDLFEINDEYVLRENETFIEFDSEIVSKVKVGDNINVSLPVRVGSKIYQVERNLTIAGFVSLDDQSFLMAFGVYTVPVFSPLLPSNLRRITHNLIIVDWNDTFSGILDEVYSRSPAASPVVTNLIVSLDRDYLLNPWDVEGSRTNLDIVSSRINNKILQYFPSGRISVTNNLMTAIINYESFSTRMVFQGVILSLPVFFVAWYVGLTVSDVSFHQRRREIGLLLTRGFTDRQLLRLFLTEAAIIGAIGAVAGLMLGIVFTPIFTMGQFTELPIVQLDTIVMVAIFSVTIALLAAFQPARKAASLRPIETLSEYFYVEEARPHRRFLIWLAFILGTYKMAMLLLGLDLSTLLSPDTGIIAPLPIGRGGGFLLNLLRGIAIFIDNILLYIGPILFFWGFVKIFIAGSLRFQNAFGGLTRLFVKDLSLLAERNVKRNANRVASTTFLLAIIMGYGVSAIGQIASQNDFTMRLIYTNIGTSGVNIIPHSLDNVTLIKDALLTNVTGVESVTVEYMGLSGQTALGTGSGVTRLVAINPEEWLSTAYYEEEWFSGDGSFDQIVKALSNETIILERRFSDYVTIGDPVYITIGGKAFSLTVVGFYGPSSSSLTGLTPLLQARASLSSFSCISESIYLQIKESVSATARILVKLRPNVNGEEVAEKIRDLPGVEWVNSAAEQIRMRDENVLISGTLNILKLGVFFAALAASIGTALVMTVTMQERRKEVTLLMVRGLSVKQTVLTLLTESFGILLVAGVMGGFVGYLVDRGSIEASRLASFFIAPKVIFPVDAIITIFIIYILLVLAAVLPIVIAVFLRSTKLVWRT